MFGRNGKMDVHLPVAVGGVERPFAEVFLERGAVPVAVAVKQDERFGQAAVTEPFPSDDSADDFFGGRLAAEPAAQFFREGELVEVREELFRGGIRNPAFQVFEQRFEHPRGCTRGRDEFYDALALRELVVALGVFGPLPFVEGPDAVVRNSGPVDIQVGKAAAEVGHLPFDLFGGEPVRADLRQIFVCKHI